MARESKTPIEPTGSDKNVRLSTASDAFRVASSGKSPSLPERAGQDGVVGASPRSERSGQRGSDPVTANTTNRRRTRVASSLSEVGLDEVVRVVIDHLAERIAERLASTLEPREREYVDQTNCGIGKRRFLKAARAGEFPSAKVGKLVVAKRVDFERWLEGRRVSAKVATDDNEAILRAAGFVLSRRAR